MDQVPQRGVNTEAGKICAEKNTCLKPVVTHWRWYQKEKTVTARGPNVRLQEGLKQVKKQAGKTGLFYVLKQWATSPSFLERVMVMI